MANRLMSRAFTKREKIMLLVLAVVLVAASYYLFVVQNVANTKASNAAQLQEVQDQIAAQDTVAAMREKMQSELEKMGQVEKLPVIATYDNLRNELDQLNAALASTSSYDLKLTQPVLTGETVRRVVTLTFTTPSYDAATAVLEALQNGKYRCVITDFSMTGKMLADGTIESVSSTLNVTYYETIAGSANTNGLQDEKSS
ncbi:MAG: type II secretion system protein GspM [Gordonibacter sp.]|uniref:type II secretion system protein GspM n=1 Tax=Gordonibacter sp. TaxID=1968902 RepID=UPI002FCB7971